MSEELNNTDSTNLTSKEFEKNISSKESANPFITSPYPEIKIEKNKFKEPDHKLIWADYIQKTYHFKQDLERVWLLMRSFELLSLIKNQGHYPCLFIKGQDTWKLGNQFKGNILGKYPFISKVNKYISLPEMKKIEWLFNIFDNEYFIIRLELFKVTEDNSTVLLSKVKFENKERFLEVKKQNVMFGEISFFQKIEQFLEKEPVNLLKYESGIISGKMEDIWDLVLDFNKFTAIAPNNNFLPNINIKNLKIEESVKASIFYGEELTTLDLTLKFKDEKPGWNKWLIVLEASGGYPIKISKHTTLLQLTKINNYECQLTLITKFHEPVNNDIYKEISNRKKYILLCIKDYFENFYCPNSNENDIDFKIDN